MKSFLAVMSREVAERRLLLYLGFVGIFPLLTPLVASGQGIPDADLRTGSGFLLAGIVGIVLAMGLGATVLGNDLSERRMGFYFARPIPGWAIWGGKLAAAFGLSLATGLLVLLPVLLLEKNARAEFFGEGSGRFAAGVALLACLVLLGNLLSTMLRSRSSWLVLDALAACTVGLLVWYTCRRLLQAELASAPVLGLLPSRPLFRGLTGLVPVAIVAALLGSAAQILHGRTDLRRGHRLLSLIFWGLLLAGSLGFVGYGQWVLAATPADLTAILGVIAAPAGSTVAVQGRAAHRTGYAPQFLLDTASGRFTRILSRSKVYFSQDGRRAAWLQAQDLSGSAPAGLVELDLARPEASPHPTPLTYAATAVGALSPDGRQFATVRRGRLTVEEIGPGRLLAAVPVGAGFDWRSQLLYTDASHLRYYRTAPADPLEAYGEIVIQVTELDLKTGRKEEVGHTPALDPSSLSGVSPDGRHILVLTHQDRLALYTDRGVLEAEFTGSSFQSTFLADGRLVVPNVSRKPVGSRQITILSAAGTVERQFELPGVRALRFGGQPIPGHLLVAVAGATPDWENPAAWETRLLDLSTGESRSLGHGLLPLSSPINGPASSGARLFLRPGPRLVLLDLVTGQERQLAGQPG